MLREQRQQAILEEMEKAGSVSVAALSELLGVSDMTVRRDLEELSARALLRKVHGGAVPVPRTAVEPHFAQKQRLNRAEKRAIARAALGFINSGDTVAFSAGTTTWQIAETLKRDRGSLTFITNSTNIALTLQENGWERIVLSGGMFRTPSDALVGPFADRTLRTLNSDVLFLGVHGVHPGAGLTTPNTAEAETDRCLVAGAQKVVVVADHTKLGIIALAKIASLSAVDVLITDRRAPDETLREIESSGVRVISVDPSEI
ncbi:MAG TPA: DeoR/GlpR family DNA-binding transcription regulator [Rubrobacteraceae bacterium]|nr:DeoR/GlpR family DNA-binding transcription regulator [Rubrobacteraceae bacterium]